MLDLPAVQLALITFLGLLSQWTAWRIKVPAILFLLLTGIVFGPWLNIIKPGQLLGDLLFPAVSICIALILFEGSLTLKFKEISDQSAVVRRMTSLGMVITWLLIALATHYWMDTSWSIAFLFGAIVVVSGPTVIMPLLMTVRPNKKVSSILRWEGILIDPIGALLAVVVYEFILSTSTQAGFTHALFIFTRVILFGGLIGFMAAYVLGTLIRNEWLPSFLHNLATFSLVAGVFASANAIEHESGLYAVTVMGITLGNMKRLAIEEIISFKEHLSLLLISGVFILLAARLEPAQLIGLGIPAIGLIMTIQFVVRPIMVFTTTWGTDLTPQEKIMLSWIYPRGIVAAAVAAIFSLNLEHKNLDGTEILVPLTFAVIIGTVVFQSLTAKPIAKLLGVRQKAPTGILFIGANQVARTIAQALNKDGFHVILADSNWEHVKRARMEGLQTFYGNPTSEYAELHLDTSNIGYVIAASPLKDLNTLACSKFRAELGDKRVFSFNSITEARSSAKHIASSSHRGRVLVDDKFTFSMANIEIKRGATLSTTTLSDTFSFADLIDNQTGKIPIYAADEKGKLRFFTAGESLQPAPGWKITSLTLTERES
ncbi:Na(+)/H(+) antiporter NhaH [BD1-7 clade bacterium]|uniref:Na(+)/H(+) antiporter NhaH n=1 Tax=BD1-7 clade bacterium TaxID=2029982 RepID=A0A5S9QJE2_9GAMM|nr:Na(+)/H(+) antiporter NhaH [BD1-7 clade bacterium]